MISSVCFGDWGGVVCWGGTLSHVQLAPVELIFILAMQLVLIFLRMLQLYITAGLKLKTAHYFGDLWGSAKKLMIEPNFTNFAIRILIIAIGCLKFLSFSMFIQTIIFPNCMYIIS